jgi:hypothetical protein
MDWKFWEKKVNPLKTEAELATKEIERILQNYKCADHREILSNVISHTFPGYGIKAHPYVKNPRKEKIVEECREVGHMEKIGSREIKMKEATLVEAGKPETAA